MQIKIHMLSDIIDAQTELVDEMEQRYDITG